MLKIKSQVGPKTQSILGFDSQIQIKECNVLKFTSSKNTTFLILPN